MHSIVPWNRYGTAFRRLSRDVAMHAGLLLNSLGVCKCRQLGNGDVLSLFRMKAELTKIRRNVLVVEEEDL